MDTDGDTTRSTSSKDAATIDRRLLLLEQLLMMMLVDSLWRKGSTATATGDCDEDSMNEMMKECMPIMRRGQSVFSQERLVATQWLLNAQLLRLMNEREEKRSAMASLGASDQQQQLMYDAAAAKMKERAAAAAAKKKRYKRNKAAAKHKKTTLMLMSWRGGRIIPMILMVAFSSYAYVTLVVPLSLIQQIDGSGEGEAPPALPPSASRSLRQKDLISDNVNAESALANIISTPYAAVVPPPIFSPTFVGNQRMKSDERASMCIDTPNWKDVDGYECGEYEDTEDPGCPGTDVHAGDMGPASQNCCYCGKGPCIDTPNWNDGVHGCAWYEENDSPGCPKYGELFGEKVMGLPKYHCCYCQRDVVALVTLPTKAPYAASCVDTPGWTERIHGDGCDWYTNNEEEGCPRDGNLVGEMGSAIENCCQCGGGSRTCEDFKSKCKAYFGIIGILEGVVSPFCKKAESCSCEATAVDHDVKIVTTVEDNYNFIETGGLYDECKCDFWSSLCESAGVGEACDYAAEYCCGDYMYAGGVVGDELSFLYLSSPTCYCDFFTYAQVEFEYPLKLKALMMINKEFENPCGQVDLWVGDSSLGEPRDFERPSLEAIYERTNGQNWTNNAGWMNEEDHCGWYGVTCNGDGFVTSIDLRDNNLAGQFQYMHATSPTLTGHLPQKAIGK
eukprot:scaffold430_cov73-Skeletonema_marinoi.AAC.8